MVVPRLRSVRARMLSLCLANLGPGGTAKPPRHLPASWTLQAQSWTRGSRPPSTRSSSCPRAAEMHCAAPPRRTTLHYCASPGCDHRRFHHASFVPCHSLRKRRPHAGVWALGTTARCLNWGSYTLAQAAMCVTKPRALRILERARDWEATREVTDLEAALP